MRIAGEGEEISCESHKSWTKVNPCEAVLSLIELIGGTGENKISQVAD